MPWPMMILAKHGFLLQIHHDRKHDIATTEILIIAEGIHSVKDSISIMPLIEQIVQFEAEYIRLHIFPLYRCT
jgi:hypothetical protein